MTEIWSHRGRVDVAGAAPDNTPEALELACARGVVGVEIDTWRTADGRFVLGHDRECPAGLVDTVARADLPERAELADALDAAPLATVNVELKVPPGAGADDAAALGQDLARWLARWRDGRPGGVRMVVSSFSRAATDAVLDAGGDLDVAWLCMQLPGPDALAALAERGYWGVHPHDGGLRIDGVAAARDAKLAVVAWTVNDPGRAAVLADAGLHAVITDAPLALRRQG